MVFLGRTLVKKTNPNALFSILSRLKSPAVCSPSFTLSLPQPRFLLGFTKLTPFSANNNGFIRSFSSCTKATLPAAEDSIPFDGCDLKHWLIVVERPQGEVSRDEIINGYIKLVASVHGSQEEARKKIYSVSTRFYYAIRVLASEELSDKFKGLPNVRWVLPDSYLNLREKDYGGEPFINGEAVPYNHKYHQEWMKNSRLHDLSTKSEEVKQENLSKHLLMDGCDFEHWLIVVEKPEGEPSRDEIIDSYVKLVASVYGNEDEARKNIYSVSTKHYYAVGVVMQEELASKFKAIPNVRWVLPDSYVYRPKEKDYGGEPFINGKAVPYDPKYHEEWTRNCVHIPNRPRFTRNRPMQNSADPGTGGRERKFERRRICPDETLIKN